MIMSKFKSLCCTMWMSLYVYHDTDYVLQHLHQSFPLKLGYGDSDMYLVMNLHKMRISNGVWAWAMSPTKRKAVSNCKFT